MYVCLCACLRDFLFEMSSSDERMQDRVCHFANAGPSVPPCGVSTTNYDRNKGGALDVPMRARTRADRVAGQHSTACAIQFHQTAL